MRQCLFCSNRGNSLEHVWPRWICEHFRVQSPNLVVSKRIGRPTVSWLAYQPELTTRFVCQRCNNGWMSRLEQQAQPYVQSLVLGENSFLNTAAQSFIALWAVKIAMVLDGLAGANERTYTAHERAQLRALSFIPRKTNVWLATSGDPEVFMSSRNRHFTQAPSAAPSAVATTIVLSRLVLQVLTVRLPLDLTEETRLSINVRRAPWQDVTVQIWPAATPAVTWPTHLGISGVDGLNLFAARFGTADAPDSDVDKMFL